MPTQTSIDRYSAIAQFWLISGHNEYRLAQVAPEFVVLSRTAAVPAGTAILVIQIDGREERRTVQVLGPDTKMPGRLRIARG